jgi:hypothetical protein
VNGKIGHSPPPYLSSRALAPNGEGDELAGLFTNHFLPRVYSEFSTKAALFFRDPVGFQRLAQQSGLHLLEEPLRARWDVEPGKARWADLDRENNARGGKKENKVMAGEEYVARNVTEYTERGSYGCNLLKRACAILSDDDPAEHKRLLDLALARFEDAETGAEVEGKFKMTCGYGLYCLRGGLGAGG